MRGWQRGVLVACWVSAAVVYPGAGVAQADPGWEANKFPLGDSEGIEIRISLDHVRLDARAPEPFGIGVDGSRFLSPVPGFADEQS